jgi:hypothetical protein
MSPRLSSDLLSYLRFICAGARPGQYLDVRWGRPGQPMRRRLLLVAAELDYVAALIVAHAPHSDVFVGACLRDGARHGGRRAIGGALTVYVECDRPDALKTIEAFAHPPSIAIASGTPGHVHAYWRLVEVASPDEIEAANRRLAAALGGDLRCTEAARVLRPPGTLNHKRQPPVPVELLASRPRLSYALDQLTAGLPSEPVTRIRRSTDAVPRCGASELERALLAIPTGDYVQALTGAVASPEGKVLCPFHAETVPSLKLYPDGTFYCFGCRRGGSIFDFAAHLWGLVPRGRGFAELVTLLGERLRDPTAGQS